MENVIICNCKQVKYNDIVSALHTQSKFDDVLDAFQEVQNITSCSTGCGGCYQKVLDVISAEMMR
jgi:NAD(P)H-nitrite reductase large subunit